MIVLEPDAHEPTADQLVRLRDVEREFAITPGRGLVGLLVMFGATLASHWWPWGFA